MQVNIESVDFTAHMDDSGKVTYTDKVIGMDRFEIIDRLEGRYAPNLKGEYFYCKGRKYHIPEFGGAWPLINYTAGQLEKMLEKSISVAEYDAMRCMLLQEEQIMNQEQSEAMKWFRELTPKAQVAQITLHYQRYMEDQQRAYHMAAGDY